MTIPCSIDAHSFTVPCASCDGERGHKECGKCGAEQCHDCGEIVVYDVTPEYLGWYHQDPTVPECFLSATLPEGVLA